MLDHYLRERMVSGQFIQSALTSSLSIPHLHDVKQLSMNVVLLASMSAVSVQTAWQQGCQLYTLYMNAGRIHSSASCAKGSMLQYVITVITTYLWWCGRQVHIRGQGVLGGRSLASASGCIQRHPSRRTCKSRRTPRS